MPARSLLAVALIAASVSAFAKPALAPVHPMSQKYSDRGAQPAKGRSGTAALEGRALLGAEGTTRVELTTGSFDTPATPAPGAIEKVQVKVFAGGELVRTDNYSKDLGGGSASFDYPDLARGDHIEVLANVRGIDGARTDVVSLATSVVRRPDLEARDLTVPARVNAGATVPIVGTVVETSGETGARFDCRLYVDGAQVDAIAGAWIDAGSNVACQFTANFSTVGTKQVVMRVTATSPTDDDAGNDAVQRAVEVAVQPFEHSEAWFTGGCWDERYRTLATSISVTYDTMSTSSGCYQGYGMYAYETAQVPYAGRIRLTHSLDGVALVPIDIDLADVPPDAVYPNCRGGNFDTGDYVWACTDNGYLQLFVQREFGPVAYISSGYLTLAPPDTVASLYDVALEFESPALWRRSELTVPIWPHHVTSDGWLPWSCTIGSGYWYGFNLCTTSYWDSISYDSRVYGQ